MMKIQSWNIQSTLGCDGIFNGQRIVDTLNKQGISDVICLQEISRNFHEYGDNDQLAFFTEAYPDHEAVWGTGFSWKFDGKKRKEFGNLTLVKRKLLEDFRIHPLPNPSAQGTYQMPRTVVEVRLSWKGSMLSIFNTHLAFHSLQERSAQIQHISHLKNQGLKRLNSASQEEGIGAYQVQAEPENFIFCGDLNLTQQSEQYTKIINQGEWMDCWTSLYPKVPHEPTCGVYDNQQWNEGPNCRDFFFATPSLAQHLISMLVDLETNASDHQPIILELRENIQ